MAKQLDPRMIDPSKDVTYTGTYFVTPSGGSDWWNTTSSIVQANSALWEESAEIVPTVTNYLSTELVTVSSLNVTEQLLSGGNDLFDIFLTPDNTYTTSVCAMGGDGITPFVMHFANGMLSSIDFG